MGVENLTGESNPDPPAIATLYNTRTFVRITHTAYAAIHPYNHYRSDTDLVVFYLGYQNNTWPMTMKGSLQKNRRRKFPTGDFWLKNL